ncbi:conserved hypothetical protein [Deferribacter desulfuricans SSM1]|uniref:Uncharacterized protein n=1 Tax=Deferribacter desulfuricans (strain DSM 14783 / JCM 11476 / NBRC 101012 / SSM1) TaxID=639282 RepID=D3PBE8_DEFDS|nr:hypothetical protein [Deferribacter desulfuricans]BAI79921.1 conserved hypothetical protein [Deferribacter desulfuricans SSM1]
MSRFSDLNPKDLYNISIANFYDYVAEIMDDFNYSFHRALKEVPNKTRCEIWKHKGSDDEALIWVEVVQDGGDVDSEVPVEVLRVMNENNLTTLFFFTNGHLNDEDKQIIDEEGYFIFTTDEIIETLIAIDKKKEPKKKVVRKKVKTPSGFILIRNYLRNREVPKEKNVIRINLIKSVVERYSSFYEPVKSIVDKIENFDDIPDDIRETLKKEQFKLLPNLLVVSTYTFLDRFQYLKVDLFNFVKLLIMYIGAIIEYEPMEDVEKYKSEIEKLLEKFNNIDKEIEEYKKDYIEENKKLTKNLIVSSVVIILILFTIIIAYVVLNGKY